MPLNQKCDLLSACRHFIKLAPDRLYVFRHTLETCRDFLVDTSETFAACGNLIKSACDHLYARRQTLETCRDLLVVARETFAARRNLIKLEREKVLRECTEFTTEIIRESTGVWYYLGGGGRLG